jgi:putative ABC transport system permease protein
MSSLRLALTMLVYQKFRTLLSILGVLVAAVLIFLQFGLIGSLKLTATQFYDAFDFDLVLISRGYFHFNAPGGFDPQRLSTARTDPEVAAAMPLHLGTICWRTPHGDSNRRYVLVLGVNPDDMPTLFASRGHAVFGRPDGARWARRVLAGRRVVLMDRSSRPEYGVVPPDIEADQEDQAERVQVTTLQERTEEVRLAGGFDIGTGFAANAVLLTSLDTLESLNGTSGSVSVGLLRLKPGADVTAVRSRLMDRLPTDVLLMTRAEIRDHESRHWTQNLPIGKFFYVGVAVAVFVGVLFIYQMMAGDIRKHEAQYATVKALGYPNVYLARVVLWQGLVLGVVGFALSLVAAWGLFGVVRAWAHVPLVMSGDLILWVLVPTMLMCLGSGSLAVRKVYQTAPADLF